MKKSLLQLFLCMATMLVVNVAQSQDYLYLINSDTIKSKVLEVNENDVKYRDFENPDDYSAQTEPPIPRQSEPLVLREKE